jgi:hypothetical protein
MLVIFGVEENSTEITTKPAIPESNNLNVKIGSLKDSYRVGEVINFTAQISGYANYCQGPHAAIWNASLFLKAPPVWSSGLPRVFCVDTGSGMPQTPNYHFADTYGWSIYQQADTLKPGAYTLAFRIEQEEPIVYQNFTVVS